jgi:hypothetical protein
MRTADQSLAEQIITALGPNTHFTYLYRDASNHKLVGSVIFKGQPVDGTDSATDQLIKSSDSGMYFIPEQVGLMGLQGSWGNYTEDDHAWHEFVALETTHLAPTNHKHIKEFIKEFTSLAQRWDTNTSAIAEYLRTLNDYNDDNNYNDGAWALNA